MSLRAFTPNSRPLWDAITAGGDLTLPRLGQIDSNAEGATAVSGAVHLTLFRSAGGARQTIKALTASVAVAGGTLARLGLYSYDGATFTRLAVAPSVTDFAGTYTTQTGQLPAPVDLAAGGLYAVGNIQLATTPASFMGSWFNGIFINSPPLQAFTYPGQTDLPASIPQSGCSANWVPIYYEVT